VVDSQLTQSPQLDVIIADNRSAPVLFQTENGTEYFPYESVYAFGEIKSGYYKDKNYIHGFSRTIRDIRDNLQREDTPPTYLGMGLSVQHPDMLEGIDKPYRNPLFSFMIFVAANDFKIEDVTDLYASTLNRYLPNVICFLDSGLMINTTTSRTDAGSLLLEQLNIHPEFNKPSIDRSDNWALIRFDSDAGYQTGANLAYLYYMLIGHLQSCVLMQPDLFRYLENLFGPFTANIIKLKT
jgi:hypothetical protein